MKRRTSLRHEGFIPIGKQGLKIWCHSPSKKLICRIDISGTRLALYTGPNSSKKIADMSWEELVKKLA